MDRNRPHEIDDRAIAIFRFIKPEELVVNDIQNPDYAKDYLVEICDRPKMTGEQAIVQLKGQESPVPSRSGNYFSFPLECKHAVYYADKVKLPVFLVLVNVREKVGYWLFMQRYLHETLRGKPWRHRKTVTVRVPLENSLADGPTFLAAIRSAREYMAAHQPAAIKAAIAAKKLSIENLDPRFEVSICATEKGEHYSLNAKQVVNITFGFNGNPDEAKQKVEDLIGRGLPVEFGPGEITVEGSPLFEELLKQGGILGTKHEVEAKAVLIARDVNDQSIARLDELRAVVRGGPQELRIESQLPDAPLMIRSTWTPNICRENFSVSFQWERWRGQPVLHLAYFDQLRAFIEAMTNSANVRFELFHRGNFSLGGVFEPKWGDLLSDILKTLTVFIRAREIARHFKVNPIVPRIITRSHMHEIDMLHAFITKGELRQRFGKGQALAITMGHPCWEVVEATILKNKQPSTSIVCGCSDLKAILLDHEFDLGDVDMEFTNVVFSNEERRKLKKRIAKGKTGDLQVRCITTDACQSIIRPVGMGV